jgi:glycosyltransferase involved in cell wall biosynthesis
VNAPLVSVCVPTRDRGAWLDEALDSVFAQTLQDFEVVVGDDASSDDTAARLAARRDPRLRVLAHGRALGVAANRNACLAAARGRYVAWLDSDDRWRPWMLSTQVAALDAHPRAAMACGGFEVVDADGRRLPDWPARFAAAGPIPRRAALRELVTGNAIGAPTVVVRHAAHDLAGPYSEALETGEDWEMWLRILLHGDLLYSAGPLAQYRWHPESLARRAERSGAQLERDRRAVLGFFDRHRDALPEAGELEGRARAALAARGLLRATDALTRNRRREAVAGVRRALEVWPAAARGAAAWRLLASAAVGAEHDWHRVSRSALAVLEPMLEGSSLGSRLRRLGADPEWEAVLARIAETVRRVVPAASRVAAIDKWDPTLLHLSGRGGWHFPDRELLPDGYPADGEPARRHLETLRARGAEFLVVPSSAFWWFESYPRLFRHVEASGRRVWADERCVIFRLGPASEDGAWAAASS